MPLSVSKNAKAPDQGGLSAQHYVCVIRYRKWLVLGTFIVISGLTVGITSRMRDYYTSETVIMVDPQKVPEFYVKPTVTGDVRNRLGTLSQQILSATRLQKIIDAFNLYPDERKTLAREEVITLMRKDIAVSMVGTGANNSQEVAAFRISYSGHDPRLVARVANEIASQFMDENGRVREAQAADTTQFLTNQLRETKAALEAQEAKLRDFKLKHVGEMPEQQQATLQILGQLQSQLQIEGDSLARAEQQKSYLQSLISQAAPVVDLDDGPPKSVIERNAAAADGKAAPAPKRSPLAAERAQLAALQAQGYTDLHPDVRRLKSDIAKQEALEAKQSNASASASDAERAKSDSADTSADTKAAAAKPVPGTAANPVLQSQMESVEAEIKKHNQEQARISRQLSAYQGKLEAIPVREQQIADLVRDYEISKAHYKQLLENQLSAETATELEIRQKGEKFSVLDPAVPAEKPARPNRPAINLGGSIAGLFVGLLLALVSEFIAPSISAPEQMAEATGVAALGVIPIIHTYTDRKVRRKRFIWGTISAAAVTVLGCAALFFYRAQ